MTNFVAFILAALLLVPALLVAIPVHEMGHALAAYFLGDRSVRYFGYLTPNPRRFLDPLGVIAVFVALVGWGRRVPVQPNRISTPAQRVVHELGGPVANLVVAIVLGFLLRFLLRLGMPYSYDLSPGLFGAAIYVIVFLNLSIFAFQLLPIPGLDGWGVIEAIFRNRNARFFYNVNSRRQQIWIGCIVVHLSLPAVPGRQPAVDRDDAVLPAREPNLIRRMRRLRDSRVGRTSSLPAVGGLVNEPAYAALVSEFGHARVVEAIREQVEAERHGEATSGEERVMLIGAALRAAVAPRLRHVINATGVILHTNLGRAPLSRAAVEALARRRRLQQPRARPRLRPSRREGLAALRTAHGSCSDVRRRSRSTTTRPPSCWR